MKFERLVGVLPLHHFEESVYIHSGILWAQFDDIASCVAVKSKCAAPILASTVCALSICAALLQRLICFKVEVPHVLKMISSRGTLVSDNSGHGMVM